MALVGDVVIKLAADVADLKTGMDLAAAKLDEFGKAATSTGEKMTSAFAKGSIIGNLVTDGFKFAIQEIQKLADASIKAGVDAENMAKKLGVTSEQAQALAIVSANTGKSMEDLAKHGKANIEWLERITAEAKAAGQVMDSEYSKAMKASADATEELNRKLAVLFAPAVAGVKSWVSEALTRMADDLKVVGSQEGLIDKIAAVLTLLKYGGSAASGQAGRLEVLTNAVASAEKVFAEAEQRAQGVPGYGVPDIVKQRAADAAKALDDARVKLAQFKDEQAKAAYGAQTNGLTSPVATVVGTKPGAGGKTDEDLMEAQIRRYEALAAAAKKTSDVISANRNKSIEDLQREVKVSQAIEDIVARLGAKYTATDKQKERLRTAVEADLFEREAIARRLQYAAQAEQIEQRLGDGLAGRKKLLEDIAKLEGGGLRGPALERFRKQQDEQQRQQELTARRFDDNLGSLGAGFEASMEKWSRAHDMFFSGEQAFEASVGALGEAFDVLAGRSNKAFGQIAADFANMLAKIALQMAVSEAFKWLIKIAGAAVSSSVEIPNNPSLTYGGPRAGGGAVIPGQYYTVGEHGPETFVPQAMGRIEPYAGNSGGDTVVVNLDMKKAEGARDPGSALEFARKVKSAVQVVIADEKRPGGSLSMA